jgi:hypothetical protein
LVGARNWELPNSSNFGRRQNRWLLLPGGSQISRDIIVKQNGGAIEVNTQPGEFTEIRVILPRAVALLPDHS